MTATYRRCGDTPKALRVQLRFGERVAHRHGHQPDDYGRPGVKVRVVFGVDAALLLVFGVAVRQVMESRRRSPPVRRWKMRSSTLRSWGDLQFSAWCFLCFRSRQDAGS
jgi:hypothetical protein